MHFYVFSEKKVESYNKEWQWIIWIGHIEDELNIYGNEFFKVGSGCPIYKAYGAALKHVLWVIEPK